MLSTSPGAEIDLDTIRDRIPFEHRNNAKIAVHRLVCKEIGVSRVRKGVYTYAQSRSIAATPPEESRSTVQRGIMGQVLGALMDDPGVEMSADQIAAKTDCKDGHYIMQAGQRLVEQKRGVSGNGRGSFVYLDPNPSASVLRHSILRLFRDNLDKEMNVAHIAQRLGVSSRQPIRRAMCRLISENIDISRVRHGVFICTNNHNAAHDPTGIVRDRVVIPSQDKVVYDFVSRMTTRIHTAIIDVAKTFVRPLKIDDMIDAVRIAISPPLGDVWIRGEVHRLVNSGVIVAAKCRNSPDKVYSLRSDLDPAVHA